MDTETGAAHEAPSHAEARDQTHRSAGDARCWYVDTSLHSHTSTYRWAVVNQHHALVASGVGRMPQGWTRNSTYAEALGMTHAIEHLSGPGVLITDARGLLNLPWGKLTPGWGTELGPVLRKALEAQAVTLRWEPRTSPGMRAADAAAHRVEGGAPSSAGAHAAQGNQANARRHGRQARMVRVLLSTLAEASSAADPRKAVSEAMIGHANAGASKFGPILRDAMQICGETRGRALMTMVVEAGEHTIDGWRAGAIAQRTLAEAIERARVTEWYGALWGALSEDERVVIDDERAQLRTEEAIARRERNQVLHEAARNARTRGMAEIFDTAMSSTDPGEALRALLMAMPTQRSADRVVGISKAMKDCMDRATLKAVVDAAAHAQWTQPEWGQMPSAEIDAALENVGVERWRNALRRTVPEHMKRALLQWRSGDKDAREAATQRALLDTTQAQRKAIVEAMSNHEQP